MSSWFLLRLEGFGRLTDFVFRFANKMYNENKTMQAVYSAHNHFIDIIDAENNTAFNNQFIHLADINGIQQFEQILRITPDEQIDTIDFRRARIINKLAMLPPFTLQFLKQKLDAIFGQGMWELEIDNIALTMKLDVETEIPRLYEQTMEDIKQIIPANILFTSVATIPYTYRYLEKHYTYEELEQFTYEQLSQYS